MNNKDFKIYREGYLEGHKRGLIDCLGNPLPTYLITIYEQVAPYWLIVKREVLKWIKPSQ